MKHNSILMACQIILLLSASFFFINPTTGQNNPTFLGYDCGSFRDNYTENSPFHTNLLNAFSNLTSLSSLNTFSNIFVGIREDAANKVFALYNCRADLTLLTCLECVEDAAKNLLQLCRPSKEASAFYEECMLRYANRPILSMMELSPWYFRCEISMPDEGELGRTIEPIFKGLIDKATSENSSRYFAVGEGSYFEHQKVYCMVQCTPDIRKDQCKECLMTALNDTLRDCTGDQVSRMTSILVEPSCQIRYNVVPFYNVSSALPLTASPPH